MMIWVPSGSGEEPVREGLRFFVTLTRSSVCPQPAGEGTTPRCGCDQYCTGELRRAVRGRVDTARWCSLRGGKP